MFPSLHISTSAIHDRAMARLPREVECSFISRPPALQSPTEAAPAPRADVRADVRATITSMSLSAAMASAPTMRPAAFPAGLPFGGPAVSAALGLPAPLFQYPGMYSHPAATAAAVVAAATAAAGSSIPSTREAHALKPLALPGGLSHYQAVNHAQLASEMCKLKTPFINRNYLELAMLVCNTFRGKLFPCPHCRYVTDRRNNLKRHVSTMHQACDKVLECCGVQFNTKASLREHIMIFHHNGYSCPYCGRRFCRKALLKRHLSVHSGQKDYRCPHCDYATSHKSNLERHKRIHDRIRIFDETGKDEFIGGEGDEDDEIEVGSESSDVMGEVAGIGGKQIYGENFSMGLAGAMQGEHGEIDLRINKGKMAKPEAETLCGLDTNGNAPVPRSGRAERPSGHHDNNDDDRGDNEDTDLDDDLDMGLEDVDEDDDDDDDDDEDEESDNFLNRCRVLPLVKDMGALSGKFKSLEKDENKEIVVDSDFSDENADVN